MSIFFRGLAAILPITGTIYLIFWLFTSIESISNSAIIRIFGPRISIPGLGILSFIAVIYFTGLLLGLVPFQRLLNKIQSPFRNIPLVKSIYSALEDLLHFFDKSKNGQDQGRVVRVKMGEMYLMGLLTSRNTKLKVESSEELCAVYVPVSYQIGGYTIFVTRDKIEYSDMSVEELMKSAITAWMRK